jgi:hypothetical protein
MKHIVLIDAAEMAKMTIDTIEEAQMELQVCDEELESTWAMNEIIELQKHIHQLKEYKEICKIALENMNNYIRENKYMWN